MESEAVRMAWREKVALNILIALSCGILLFYIIGLGQLICPKTSVLSQGEIDGRNHSSNPYVSMYGYYYRIPEIVDDHVVKAAYLNNQAMEETTLGHDVSAMFFKYCPGLPAPANGWDNIVRQVPDNAMTVWNYHRSKDSHGRNVDYLAQLKPSRKGALGRDSNWIAGTLANDPINTYIIVAYDKVYDVSQYLNPSFPAQFLGPNLIKLFQTFGKTGKDSSVYLDRVKSAEGKDKFNAYMKCMDEMFFVGVVDHRSSGACLFSNYMLLASSIVLCMIIGFKFIAALQFSPPLNPENQERYVICVVPCYTEGVESIRASIDSIVLSKYDDSRKCLFIVADGMITGSGNDLSTPDILLRLLGTSQTGQEAVVPYLALGEADRRLNRAKVYSGHYVVSGRSMPYVLVIKIGGPDETHRAGNRGKRDSQIVIMRFLSRVLLKSPLDPLDVALYRNFKSIGLDPSYFEFLLWVDADTEVFPDGINRFVAAMADDSSMAGICGETLLRNENDSWVTMIQVYEYFISHHLAKAFESLFGSVTCLPGCFCMYRIYSTMADTPVLAGTNVVKDYAENKVITLHLKNLLSLGEDRYLTTLMLKHFPDMKLKFISQAKAMTNAPTKWDVLLSQRRRWINSTVHNLLELVLLKNLCGFCCLSMRFVVFLDLFATVVSPAGFVYVIYLVFSTIFDEEAQIPTISLIMIGAIYGLQVIIFVLKREWQHIGWMIVYILAMPIYSFYLPLYSFWRMDDFSWGTTRVVVSDKKGDPDIEGVVIVDGDQDEMFALEMQPFDSVL